MISRSLRVGLEDVALGAGWLPVACPPARTLDLEIEAGWSAFSLRLNNMMFYDHFILVSHHKFTSDVV